jgi:hypothetical protein
VEATYNPFAILNVGPDVTIETARSSYRKLARQHHPDMVPEHERDTATRLMAALNEAMAELERDFEGWSLRFCPQLRNVDETQGSVLSVEPRFLILREANGFDAYLTVATPSGDARQIRLRYEAGLIVAERLRVGSRGVVNFRVRVSPKLRVLERPERVEVELVAVGHAPVNVTVAVEPFSVRVSDDHVSGAGQRVSWWQRLRNRL